MVAVFINGGEADAALGKAMICALLLALTLALQGLLGIQQNRPKHRSLSTFSRRLVRFGYNLSQAAAWFVFFELTLQIWDLSMFGLAGKPPVSKNITSSLFGVAVVLLVTKLTWIFIDELLERTLGMGDRKNESTPPGHRPSYPLPETRC